MCWPRNRATKEQSGGKYAGGREQTKLGQQNRMRGNIEEMIDEKFSIRFQELWVSSGGKKSKSYITSEQRYPEVTRKGIKGLLQSNEDQIDKAKLDAGKQNSDFKGRLGGAVGLVPNSASAPVLISDSEISAESAWGSPSPFASLSLKS